MAEDDGGSVIELRPGAPRTGVKKAKKTSRVVAAGTADPKAGDSADHQTFGTKKSATDRGDKLCDSLKSDKSGNRCKNAAGFGTDHPGYGKCKHHGGNSPTHQTAAAREQAQELMAGMGSPLIVTPDQALLAEVYRSAGHVGWMESVIAGWGYGNPRELLLELNPDNGYQKAAWFKVYQEERTHLAKVSKMAIDAGVARAIVELASQQVDLINSAVTAILTDLGHDTADTNVRHIVGRRLSEVAAIASATA